MNIKVISFKDGSPFVKAPSWYYFNTLQRFLFLQNNKYRPYRQPVTTDSTCGSLRWYRFTGWVLHQRRLTKFYSSIQGVGLEWLTDSFCSRVRGLEQFPFCDLHWECGLWARCVKDKASAKRAKLWLQLRSRVNGHHRVRHNTWRATLSWIQLFMALKEYSPVCLKMSSFTVKKKKKKAKTFHLGTRISCSTLTCH